MFIDSIIIILIILFSLAIILLLTFLFKYFQKQSPVSSSIQISVVIAGKNEEKNIPKLINHLSLLDYPKENFEIIIIDDGSNDNTFEAAAALTKDYSNFSVIKAEEKKYPAKKGALDFGINKAKYPYVLITDADCFPGNAWLKSFAGKFSGGFDFVYGPIVFNSQENIVNKISSFERLRNSILTFSLAQINFHYTASGGNFGFKKSSFEKLNGYSNTLKTFSGDDDLLLQQAIKNKYKIGIINDKNAFVHTGTKNNLGEYLLQKARHTKTSLYYLPSRKLFLSAWHLINIIFLLSALLAFINPSFIFLFIGKMLLDGITVIMFQKKFGYSFNILEIFYLQVIYEILLIINFILALAKKDNWK